MRFGISPAAWGDWLRRVCLILQPTLVLLVVVEELPVVLLVVDELLLLLVVLLEVDVEFVVLVIENRRSTLYM